MRVAIGQFAAKSRWRENLDICNSLMERSASGGADLLVLPEGVQARFESTPTVEEFFDADQPISGPFVQGLKDMSRGSSLMTIVGTKGTKEGCRYNTLAVIQDGEIVASYDKLHLMDALGGRESDQIHASMNDPVVIECVGHKVGLMTCYDVRFPEMARLLALEGAEVIALPAAWVKGPQKERHWQVLTAARALENTCYLAASGECGPNNVGMSMLIDPFGVVLSQLGHENGLIFGDIDFEYLKHVRTQLPVLENRRFEINSTVLPVPRDYATDPMPDLEELIAKGRVRRSDTSV